MIGPLAAHIHPARPAPRVAGNDLAPVSIEPGRHRYRCAGRAIEIRLHNRRHWRWSIEGLGTGRAWTLDAAREAVLDALREAAP